MLTSGFPGGSDGKASACNAGDPGSIPGSGRSSGEGNGSPLQYSCLENSMDWGAWQATVPWGRKESDTTERLQKKKKLTSLGFLGHFRKEGKTGERKIDVREYPHTLWIVHYRVTLCIHTYIYVCVCVCMYTCVSSIKIIKCGELQHITKTIFHITKILCIVTLK